MASEPWLRLVHAASSGGAHWRKLLRTKASAEVLVGLSGSELAAAGVTPGEAARLHDADAPELERWRRWLDGPDRHLVGLSDPRYPRLLKTLSDAPLALWVHGRDLALLDGPQLAIVGSRNPTHNGRDTAKQFARYLSERGLTITSGLATGIDGASHEGALDGGASTVAVLGCGLDTLYPQSNAALAQRIAAEGALVSEFPPGTPPRPANFPQRNRIIAGSSLGTLVVEAARRSGSLITARLAADYGREVFAIPGSIHNPLAKGCHELIRQGAKLVDDVADILVELAPLLNTQIDAPAPGDTRETESFVFTKEAAYTDLLEAMGFDPVSLSSLAERSGLTPAELSSMLLILEFEGLVEALPGGRYARLAMRNS
ncbi:MAG: DNA-processing protein DprA [Gammaproteobacteria bacterium]|nr:DNA-processing protein DprA [Gammaproteobacteria bacterium]MDH3507639.1 DNA-processing protein DprA [Gammaproteobacteria bacterium]